MALTAGALLGALVTVTRHNPFWHTGQPFSTGLLHGGALTLIVLGGLSVTHRGGPIRLSLSGADLFGRRALRSFRLGLALGLPLAVVNVLSASTWEPNGPGTTGSTATATSAGAFSSSG
jgi:hypothetical protein